MWLMMKSVNSIENIKPILCITFVTKEEIIIKAKQSDTGEERTIK